MRLKSIRLENYGPFKVQEIELAPLTILFGPNGAGKSTVLDAIEDALTLSGGRRQLDTLQLGVGDEGSAVVYATLENRLIPGSSDQLIMRHVLWKNLKGVDDSAMSLGDPYKKCPTLDDLMQRMATVMIDSGQSGTPEARVRIANHLLEHSVLAFGGLQGEAEGNWGLVCFASLEEVADFARTFDTSIIYSNDHQEAFDAEQDSLLMAVESLKRGEDALVTMEWGERERELSQQREFALRAPRTLFSRIRPLPMRLDFDPMTLELELEGAVDRITGKLRFPNQDYETRGVSWLVSSESPQVAFYGWLDEPQEGVAKLDPSRGVPDFIRFEAEKEEYVLSPLVRKAVTSIAEHANLIAPNFVTENSRIEIEIVPPPQWQPSLPRLRVSILQGGLKIPLTGVGSGIARWASYSIRLACQELFRSQIVFQDDDGRELPDEAPYQIPNDVTASLVSNLKLQIAPQSMDVVLLIDEPEAHLHPRAVDSVGQWLLNFSPRVAAVVVATHHPSLFSLRGPSVQKHVLLKHQRVTVSEPWDPASEDLVAQLARDIGLTPGDLFMMSRYALFLEGPHDLVILEEFFGELLRGTSVRLLLLHGAHNISLLATSDISGRWEYRSVC